MLVKWGWDKGFVLRWIVIYIAMLKLNVILIFIMLCNQL